MSTFAVVQHRNRVEIVPDLWIVKNKENDSEIVMWPKSDWSVLQKDASSKPVLSGPDQWEVGLETVKRRGIISYSAGEGVADIMMNVSDSDTDTSRPPPTRSVTRSASNPGTSRVKKVSSIASYGLPDEIFQTTPTSVRETTIAAAQQQQQPVSRTS